MLWACVLLPQLALDAVLRRRPDPQAPLALVEGPAQLRTLHAVIVCSLMTLLVFSLLALSSIPVLRAIGSTVALGVLLNFALSLLIARAPVRE